VRYYIFFVRKKTRELTKKNDETGEEELLEKITKPEPLDTVQIEDLILDFLSKSIGNLNIIPEIGLNEALHKFVEKEEKLAIGSLVDDIIDKTQKHLFQKDPNDNQELETQIKKIFQIR